MLLLPWKSADVLFFLAHGQTNALGRILRQQIILNGGIEDAIQKRSPVATSRIGIFRQLIVKPLDIFGRNVSQTFSLEVGDDMLVQVHVVVNFCPTAETLGLIRIPPVLRIILEKRIGVFFRRIRRNAFQHSHLLMEGLAHLRDSLALHPDVPELS